MAGITTARTAIAAELRRLPSGWHSVGDIPLGDLAIDLDHVVVGPGGLFTVHVECHPDAVVRVAGDAVQVDDHRHRFVRHSRYEARRASAQLSTSLGYAVVARGVVTFVGQRLLALKSQPADVHVTNLAGLSPWLRAQPAVLSPYVVELLYTAAAHPMTWSTTLSA